MSIEAMKQALEALESKYLVGTGAWRVQQDQAVTALRQAIAEAKRIVPSDYPNSHQQEPVAWVYDTGTHIDLNVSGRGKPLYTHPPKREWHWLTDEEIYEAFDTIIEEPKQAIQFCYNIQAKLKEKNT